MGDDMPALTDQRIRQMTGWEIHNRKEADLVGAVTKLLASLDAVREVVEEVVEAARECHDPPWCADDPTCGVCGVCRLDVVLARHDGMGDPT